ncbi:fluoride efflux transporter FluC [Streptomyces sp. NPDC001544]|uniref:fluoride efflux transporter FluC n=1 Tax=Streptomyces sp. NPDC001544 TaxID=3364584 RepID=UPI0036C7283C
MGRSAVAKASRRPKDRRGQWPVLAAVAAGGAIGASARFEAALLWPTGKAGFPWTTLGVNAVGCLVIGVFLVSITEVWAPHPLLRPFFGTGVLGGFTTFSTYCIDIERLVRQDRPGLALAYLVGTVVVAMGAAKAGVVGTRRILATRGP